MAGRRASATAGWGFVMKCIRSRLFFWILRREYVENRCRFSQARSAKERTCGHGVCFGRKAARTPRQAAELREAPEAGEPAPALMRAFAMSKATVSRALEG